MAPAEERAVSPVVGTILMVALVLLLASVATMFLTVDADLDAKFTQFQNSLGQESDPDCTIRGGENEYERICLYERNREDDYSYIYIYDYAVEDGNYSYTLNYTYTYAGDGTSHMHSESEGDCTPDPIPEPDPDPAPDPPGNNSDLDPDPDPDPDPSGPAC